MYTIVFSEDAKKDLKELNKRSPQAVSKLSKRRDEVREHPRTGTGQVEQLKATMALYIPDESPKNIDSFTRSTMK